MPWLSLTIQGIFSVLRAVQAALPLISAIASLIFIRLFYLLCTTYKRHDLGRNGERKRATCHVAVFLGSGGHTKEMLQLLKALPAERYTPRTYFVSSGDKFSTAKAIEHEQWIASQNGDVNKNGHQSFNLIVLPRARNVHQAWLSTPLSVLTSFASCLFRIVLLPSWQAYRGHDEQSSNLAELILMNGPGTCVPIVAAVYVRRILGLASPRLLYVESFARVRSLSLTGRILRYFVDMFVVQWDQASVVRGAHFHGCLV